MDFIEHPVANFEDKRILEMLQPIKNHRQNKNCSSIRTTKRKLDNRKLTLKEAEIVEI